ncbi:MAG: hypothetical protein IKZ02_00985 [Alphaproteobacteria bacterium]|nr:hypothetical protein [Alphaproteobacteria bacterium]
MIYTVLLFRLIFAIWIFSLLGILLYKISTGTISKKTDLSVWLLFPILILTHKGRSKIKGNL